jgi:metacaspase-1
MPLNPAAAKIAANAVSIRRGPVGRWIPVPVDAPSDVNEIGAETFALSGVLDSILDCHREAKMKRYEAKRRDPKYKGPVIIAEGDSWFEYPYNDDIVSIVGKKYAVMPLAKAGDSWIDIYRKNELFPAIEQEDPDIVMLSLGGNDVLGQIEIFIHPYEMNRPAAKYILPNFKATLDWIENQYVTTIQHVLTKAGAVIIHGYDYPDPREPATQGAQWVGPPLKNLRNIDGVGIWREIANIMIDRFNDMLSAVAKRPEFVGRVYYVNLRKTIGSDDILTGPKPDLWCDEIHGTAAGFGKIAAKFAKTIEKAWNATGV